MKNYIFSIIAAGIICSVINSLLNDKNTIGTIVKLLSGIFMCLTILSPVTHISFSNIERYFGDLSLDADIYADAGIAHSKTEISSIIKSQSEAYILDKANSMGLDIGVEVELDDENNFIPYAITINGPVSPYIKELLGDYIENHLGITKENQRWI